MSSLETKFFDSALCNTTYEYLIVKILSFTSRLIFLQYFFFGASLQGLYDICIHLIHIPFRAITEFDIKFPQNNLQRKCGQLSFEYKISTLGWPK